MDIKINGKIQVVEAQTLTIGELLKITKVENPEMVSVQLNGEFVDKENFKTVAVNNDDEIDFLYFMGGGAS